MKCVRYALVACVVLVLAITTTVDAQQVGYLATLPPVGRRDPALIPNGHRIDVNGHWWPSPFSATWRGTTAELNAFGTAFVAAGSQWTAGLCGADSDGDGFTNGEELGDPSCSWTAGAVPARTVNISHPGLWHSVPEYAYPGRAQTAAASCSASALPAQSVAQQRDALRTAVAAPAGLRGISRAARLATVFEPAADTFASVSYGSNCPQMAAGAVAWHSAATWGGSVPAAART